MRNRILAIITTVLLSFYQVGSTMAFEVPSPPSAPTPPPVSAPSSEPISQATSPPAPTPPPAPFYGDDDDEEEPVVSPTPFPTSQPSPGSAGASSTNPSPTPTTTSGQNANGQVGDPSITTGDALNNANIISAGNLNGATGSSTGDSPSASVINSQNGAYSDNSGSLTVVSDDNTFQTNSAVVTSNLDQATTTGTNSASYNVGDSSITTGNANTTGTVITAVNTNVDGVAVAEFNVTDDHTGDIILDFSTACIAGCGDQQILAANHKNGAYSDNDASIDQTTNANTFQTNDAIIGSELNLSADSGSNLTSFNTGGDSSITTHDANVAANALTFVNNNLAGNVLFGVVNIMGDLVGDIVLPDDQLSGSCCGTNLLAGNLNNGASSTNNATIDQTLNSDTFQFNDATIENNLILDANTGANSASFNTGDDSSITTGQANVNAQVLNVANSNLAGGTWWLVVVNEAGRWIGRILGAPDGANFAGSPGTEFVVDDNGTITAVNNKNGALSNNDSNISQTTNSTVVQDNNAQIVNNLNLSANTGGNSASYNTGGSSSITTGNANIIANIVNFVNNNITGNGRLVVTVVNVFGSWLGDFVTPGQKQQGQEVAQASGQGGQSQQPAIAGNSSGQQSAGSANQGSGPSTNNSSGGSVLPSSPISPVGVAQLAGVITQVAVLGAGSDEVGQVLGSKLAGAAVSKKVLNINLAWGILLVPIIGGYLLVRRIKSSARRV